MYLITRWFGTFIFDNKKIVEKILFPKNEEDISKRLKIIEKGKILPEEKKIIKNKDIIVNEKRLSVIGKYKPKDGFFNKINIKPDDFGFSNDLLKKANIFLTDEKIKEELKNKDLQLVQMVNALTDLIQTNNLLKERVDCWSVIPNYEEKIDPIFSVLKSVESEINNLEEEIKKDMLKIAPNISDLVGPMIGAKLISQAGSLKKLACFPASTVQILGAEKALFRFKKEGGRPPKHGIIYQHYLINKSQKKYRGRISRALANKISIAAKADAFTKNNLSKDLIDELEKQIKEIKNQ